MTGGPKTADDKAVNKSQTKLKTAITGTSCPYCSLFKGGLH